MSSYEILNTEKFKNAFFLNLKVYVYLNNNKLNEITKEVVEKEIEDITLKDDEYYKKVEKEYDNIINHFETINTCRLIGMLKNEKIIKDVGKELFNLGGLTLMEVFFYTLPAIEATKDWRTVERFWSGIGGWTW